MTSKPTRWEQGAFIHSRQSATWSSEYVAECVEREKKMVFCAGQPVAKFMNPEDARRTVACVNACNGLPTNALEGLVAKGGRLEGADWYVEMLDRQLEQAEDQREELLAALEPFARLNSSEDTIRIEVSTADVARARAAIAKVKGGSA